MVGVTKIGRGNAKYWIEAVAEGGEDYYTKPGERPGEWIGELAAELGLDGRGRPRGLLRSARRRAPGDRRSPGPSGRHRGSSSTPPAGPGARSRSSATTSASAPRSPSRCSGRSARRRSSAWSSEAVDRAVRAAYAHLEREACFVQRGKGGTDDRARRRLRLDGLPAPLLAGRRPRAPRPRRDRQHDPRRLRRQWLSLANPRRQIAAPARGEIDRLRLPGRAARRADPASSAPRGGRWSTATPTSPGSIAPGSTTSGAAAPRSSRRWSARDAAPQPPPKSPPTGPATPRTTTSTPTPARRLALARRRVRIDGGEHRRRVGGARRAGATTDRPADLDGALAALEATRSHFDRRDVLCAIADRMQEGAAVDELEAAVEQVLAGRAAWSVSIAARVCSAPATSPLRGSGR